MLIAGASCKEAAPAEPGEPTFVRGLWKSVIPMDTVEYEYGSANYLEYVELGPGSTGTVYLQTRDYFRWSVPATYAVDGVDVRVTASFVVRDLVYDHAADRLNDGDRPYARSSDSAVVSAWEDSVRLTQSFVVPGVARRSLVYQGLAFDGTSFYTLEWTGIRIFSAAGESLRVAPLPPADSLSGGFRPYATGIAFGGGDVWLSVAYYDETQRIYRLRPDSLTPVGSVVLSQTSREIKALAVSEGGDTIWAIAQGFLGDARRYLHAIDAATGNELGEARLLEADSEPLGASAGFLWGERIVSSSSDIARRHYLQEFDPVDRMTRRSLRVTGFENVIPVPYTPRITGVTIFGTDLYVLDGYDHTLWRGLLPP